MDIPTNPLSTFYRHPDILLSILQWLDIKQRIYLLRCNKELQGIIFDETKDLDWKIRKSRYLIYSVDLKSSLKQVKHFEQQANLPKIQNATIPSSVVGLSMWSGESLHVEPLPWDSNTVLACCNSKLQVVHFTNNRCTIHTSSCPLRAIFFSNAKFWPKTGWPEKIRTRSFVSFSNRVLN
jgi:hypothetical protein